MKTHYKSMTRKKVFSMLIFIVLLLNLNFVLAQTEDLPIRFYHEIETNLTISETCRVDGAICDASYSCDLSVLDPNQDTVLDTITMLNGGTYWNFTLNETQTTPNGIYTATVDCTNSTLAGSNTFYYQVTPDGSKPIDTGQSLVLIVALSILIIIALAIGFLGFKSTNTTIMLTFLSFAVLLIIFALGFMLNVIELSFGTFSTIINNYSTIYILFTSLIAAGAIGLILYLVFVALNYYWQLRGMKDTFRIKE